MDIFTAGGSRRCRTATPLRSLVGNQQQVLTIARKDPIMTSSAPTWSPGYCNITQTNLFTSCWFGSRGAIGLSEAEVSGGWERASAACVHRCLQCSRCAFVSMSLQFNDCSWYAACDLSRLNDATTHPAFWSAAVNRGIEAQPAALTLSREYPARMVASPPVRSVSRLRLASRMVEGRLCVSPAGLPVDEPHRLADLETLESAMAKGRVVHTSHTALILKTINPDNVAEVMGTLLSALSVQVSMPATRGHVCMSRACVHAAESGFQTWDHFCALPAG